MVWEGSQPLQKHVAHRPSSATPGGRRTVDRRERTQHTHRRRPADTRDFLHTQHTASTSLRILCAPSPDGGGQEKNLAGEKNALPRSRIPVLPPPPSRRGFSAKSLPCTDPRGWGSTGSRFPANGGGQSGRMGGRRREGRAADRRCSQWPPSVVCRALSSAGAGSGGATGDVVWWRVGRLVRPVGGGDDVVGACLQGQSTLVGGFFWCKLDVRL